MKQILLVAAAILLAFSAAYSQDVAINSSIDNDSLLIGSQMNFNIGVTLPKGSYVVLNGPGESVDQGIEVINSTIDSSMNGDRVDINYKYLITSFDSGRYTIPSYKMTVKSGSVAEDFYTDSMQLFVYSPPVDTSANIKDVKAVINAPLTFREILPYAGGFLGLLIVLAIIILLVRRMKGKEPVRLKREVVVPPYVKALQTLDKLKLEKIWQKGRVKEYYVVLSDTVRKYVEEQFGVDAMESTTDETLQKFKRFAHDDHLLLEMLESLLNLSDLVKFAKEDPTPTENETNLNNAYLFVEKTRPADVGVKNDEEN
ncbi:MAG TPA: hypothetical protein VE870_07950 [Bacteroidales bacterium]|nr:hypothetical protein [Bacteroidales bacterium]